MNEKHPDTDISDNLVIFNDLTHPETFYGDLVAAGQKKQPKHLTKSQNEDNGKRLFENGSAGEASQCP